MADNAKLVVDGKDYDLPVVVGTEGERGVDISRLRADLGHITLDTGYNNTAECQSEITFVDGEAGILRYRGIPVEQMAQESTFVVTSAPSPSTATPHRFPGSTPITSFPYPALPVTRWTALSTTCAASSSSS